MDFDATAAQSCRHLKPDEACTKDDRFARRLRARDDGTAIRKRAKRMNVGLIAPGNPKTNRLSSSRKQQPIVRNGVPIRERYLPRA